MSEHSDRKFDWIAGLALASGTAVMVPSMAVLVITLLAILIALF